MPGDRMRVAAHAKLNVSLRVLAREASGFHQIETIFCALELGDEIEIVRGDRGITITTTELEHHVGLDTTPDRQNLAWRAADLFVREALVDEGIHIALGKRIPVGAGLGGGSSDAAAVLMALNHMFERPLSTPQVRALGARLGSDVPFFLTRASLALAWGRGGRIAPLTALPSAPVVLAIPPERVSTADAYAALAVRIAGGTEPAVFDVHPRSWRDIAGIAHNDFEDVVFRKYPRLDALRQLLDDAGATIARMTGSGSVVFGIFDDDADAARAADLLARRHRDVATVVTRTCA